MEIEIYLLMALVGGLGFCIGSFIAPVNKHLKSHIRFLEGKMSKYKQEKKSDSFDIEGLLDGGLSITNIMKLAPQVTKLLQNPEVQKILSQAKTGQTKDVTPKDQTTWR